MCSDSPPPDPQIGAAALANVQLSKDMIDYYKSRDAEQKPRQAMMDELATKLANQQLSTSQFNDAQARDMFDRYKTTGIPAEDAMYADAKNYDSKDRLDSIAAEAGNDVDMASAQAADTQRRTLAREGVNPADGRSLAMGDDMAAQAALGKATAMNKARTDARTQAIMLRKDAASFARGMPGTAAQTFGTAAAAGAGAQGAVGGAIGSANSTAAMMGTGFNGAVGANNSAGSILNQEYGTQTQGASGSGIAAGIGGIAQGIGSAGGIATFFSDENMKEEVKPVSDDAALDGIKKTKVKSWKYKKGSPADDGGQPHVGAMAQDMQKNLGDTVAPGGTKVDVISALGVNMAAIKSLGKKVDRMQAVIAKGVKNG